MASNHIELVGNETRLAATTRRLVDKTGELQNDLKRLRLIMDEAGATSSDWPAVKAAFGFHTDADAQAAYPLLTAAVSKINNADIDNFVNRLG